MKRMICTIFVLFFMAGTLFGCSNEPDTIKNTFSLNYSDINRIVISDGRGGFNKPITLSNRADMDKFYTLIDQYSIIKQENQERIIGWIHMASLYKDDKLILNITFGSPMMINDSYYKVVDGTIDSNEIDKYLHDINDDWNIFEG